MARGQHGPRATRLARKRVRFLRRFFPLRYFAPTFIEKGTLFTASFAFATSAFFVAPTLKQHSAALQIVGVFLGALPLGFLFLLVRWGVSLLATRRLRGDWVTTATLDGKDEPFVYGAASFSMSVNATLSLRTHLYDDLKDALKHAQGDPAAHSVAMLQSQAFSLDGSELSILYELTYDNPPETRHGQFHLHVKQGVEETVLEGRWLSSNGTDLRAGQMVMKRPELVAEEAAERASAIPEVAVPAAG